MSSHTTTQTGFGPLAVLIGTILAFSAPGSAQEPVPPGRPIRIHPVPRPAPQVRATLLKVVASIQDGIATTELRQTLYNDGGGQAEATWLLPLPPGATADQFTMTVGGTEIEGEVLDPQKARRIYEDIVRRRRDPGLLEYVGHGCLRARVFPIPPKGSIEVKVRYRQILPETAGLFTFEFPLRAAGIEGRPTEKLSLDLQIRSRKPIKTVYSPLPGVDVVQKGDHEARASLEIDGGQLPAHDLTVFYGTSTQAFGLDLLSWRPEGKPGYFLLMVTPRQEWPEPKNTLRVVQFVLDTSGSMQGKKIDQARNALRFFVRSLEPGDRFNVVPFSTEARPFFPNPVEVGEETLGKALALIDEIEARGGTNIEDGLRTALTADLPAPHVPLAVVPIIVFLTDGQPTVGMTDVAQLEKEIAKWNRHGARVFVFGVGDDVNTKLLDRVAAQSRGDRDYVREHEDIEVKTAALFTKLSNPVLTDVSLTFDGVEVFDLSPKDLPDLFKGSRLMVAGRYRGDGHKAVRLKGKVDGAEREYVYEAQFPDKAAEHDFVGTIWAQRRIAVLLDAIRLNGQSKELVDEVQRLGREFGIVTPFTSHLIVEEGMQVAQARGFEPGRFGQRDRLLGVNGHALERLGEELARAGAIGADDRRDLEGSLTSADEKSAESKKRMENLPEAAAGGEAVNNSLALLSLRQAGRAAAPPRAGNVGLLTHRVGGRAFHLVGGVWVDRAFEAKMRGAERKIEAFSDEYFALLREHPELGACLAFSTRIVLVVDGEAIEIL